MTPPTEGMLRAMLELQDSMNRKINPEWLSAGYPFLRAVLVEAVEITDSRVLPHRITGLRKTAIQSICLVEAHPLFILG